MANRSNSLMTIVAGALRQIEAAELMIAMNNFSNSYVRSLEAATPKNQLAAGFIPRQRRAYRTSR
jgi:hypothetical protein